MYWSDGKILGVAHTYHFEIHVYEWFEEMLLLSQAAFRTSKLKEVKTHEFEFMYTLDYFLSSYILNKFMNFPNNMKGSEADAEGLVQVSDDEDH